MDGKTIEATDFSLMLVENNYYIRYFDPEVKWSEWNKVPFELGQRLDLQMRLYIYTGDYEKILHNN